ALWIAFYLQRKSERGAINLLSHLFYLQRKSERENRACNPGFGNTISESNPYKTRSPRRVRCSKREAREELSAQGQRFFSIPLYG
ncbi:MAG: hypothetical protein LBD59_04530, partial [Prevotellaceae bacterium]|nr:hypothetical protein [Prevotellaceae bacterium]